MHFFLPPKKFEVQCTISNHDLYLQLTAMVSSDTYRIEMEEQTSRSQWVFMALPFEVFRLTIKTMELHDFIIKMAT